MSILATLTVSLCSYLKKLPILPEGPAVQIAAVTRSLWEEGTLHPEHFSKIYVKAAELSRVNSTVVWQDVFAIDKHGELIQKHSLFSAIAAVPFYAIFGNFGFWLFQLLFTLLLLLSTYKIVEELNQSGLPWSTFVATTLLSQTLFYSYDFSYELHGCALIMAGLWISLSHPFWGGILLGLSVFVSPANILLALPLAFLKVKSSKSTASIILSLLGLGIISILFLITNYLLWGNPFSTAYSNLLSFHNGEAIYSAHPIGFNLEVFKSNWPEKIFSSEGILPYNLSFIALPFAIKASWQHVERSFLLRCFLVGLAFNLYIFSYPMWATTFYGNRYIFTGIYLYLLSLIVWLGQFENLKKKKLSFDF
ncbi:MAG: hypothetical protein SGJ02_02405 [bacterium]|nr:hypothetical protein [bacterium]